MIEVPRLLAVLVQVRDVFADKARNQYHCGRYSHKTPRDMIPGPTTIAELLDVVEQQLDVVKAANELLCSFLVVAAEDVEACHAMNRQLELVSGCLHRSPDSMRQATLSCSFPLPTCSPCLDEATNALGGKWHPRGPESQPERSEGLRHFICQEVSPPKPLLERSPPTHGRAKESKKHDGLHEGAERHAADIGAAAHARHREDVEHGQIVVQALLVLRAQPGDHPFGDGCQAELLDRLGVRKARDGRLEVAEARHSLAAHNGSRTKRHACKP